MVERMTLNHVVAGSIPAVGAVNFLPRSSMNGRGCSSIGRAVALQATGTGIETRHLHHYQQHALLELVRLV